MKRQLTVLFGVLAATTWVNPSLADEAINIFADDQVFIVGSGEDAIEISRVKTSCAKIKGWLQPLIPVAGVHPVTEIEVLHALNDTDAVVVDMRTPEWYLEATIPTAINIPYTDVSMRMDELGCEKQDDAWQCKDAKKVYGFCNGPACSQSPSAMKAMVRDGFPADKIYYYRGGMMDWEILGLTTVEGDF